MALLLLELEAPLVAAVCTLGQYDSGGGVCVACPAGQFGTMSGANPVCSPCTAPTPFSNAGETSCYGGCPDLTWTPWVDAAGVEGAHSCVKVLTGLGGYDWTQAQAACTGVGAGVHLLSARQVTDWAQIDVLLVEIAARASLGFQVAVSSSTSSSSQLQVQLSPFPYFPVACLSELAPARGCADCKGQR